MSTGFLSCYWCQSLLQAKRWGDQKEVISWRVCGDTKKWYRTGLLQSLLGSVWCRYLCRCRDWWGRSFPLRINLIRVVVGQVSVGLLVLMWRFIRRIRVSIWLGQKFGVVWEIPIWAMFLPMVPRKKAAFAIASIVCLLPSFPKQKWKKRATVIYWTTSETFGTIICYNKYSKDK